MTSTCPHPTKLLAPGLIPVMLTPFTDTGAIDWDQIPALVDWYLAAGASGLFAVCLSSRMYDLNQDERVELARAVVQAADGRVPVVATGTFGGSVAAQAESVLQMAETGVAAVVVITSQLAAAEEPDARWLESMQTLMTRCPDIPLGLYECPLPYKRLLTPAMFGELAASGRFFYHKDTSCDAAQIRAKVQAAAGTPLRLYNAHSPIALQSLRDGAAGLSPIAANVYPERLAQLCSLAQRDHQAAEHLQHWLSDHQAAIATDYPASLAGHLRQQGLHITRLTREPVTSASADRATDR